AVGYGGAVFAIEIQRQGIDSHSPPCIKQPQHQIIILRNPQSLVIVGCWTSQDRFTEQRLEIAEPWSSTVEGVELDIAADFDPEGLTWPAGREEWAWRLGTARVELDEVVRYHIGIVAAGHLDKRRQPVGVHEVVAVHDGNPLAFCQRKRSVARRGGPAIAFASDKANSRIFGHQFSYDPGTLIARRIVGNDDLEIAQALPLDRSNGIRQVRGTVVVGHDDADRRPKRHALRKIGRSHREILSFAVAFCSAPGMILRPFSENPALSPAKNPNDQPACIAIAAMPAAAAHASRCLTPKARPYPRHPRAHASAGSAKIPENGTDRNRHTPGATAASARCRSFVFL